MKHKYPVVSCALLLYPNKSSSPRVSQSLKEESIQCPVKWSCALAQLSACISVIPKHEITKKQTLHWGRIPAEQDVSKICWGNAGWVFFFQNYIHTSFTCAGLMFMHNNHGMRSD